MNNPFRLTQIVLEYIEPLLSWNKVQVQVSDVMKTDTHATIDNMMKKTIIFFLTDTA